jgi:hypothetical protein
VIEGVDPATAILEFAQANQIDYILIARTAKLTYAQAAR